MDCSGLTSINIPDGVTSIGSRAFGNCPEITDVTCKAELLTTNEGGDEGLYTSSDAFNDSYPEKATLHVPESAINSYQTTEPWSKFGKFVTLSSEEIGAQRCLTPLRPGYCSPMAHQAGQGSEDRRLQAFHARSRLILTGVIIKKNRHCASSADFFFLTCMVHSFHCPFKQTC